MIKKHIITALLAATAMGVQAQQRDIPVMKVHLKDGTSHTFTGAKMYGVNNPTADDYVDVSICEFNELGNLRYSCKHTLYGNEAESDMYGIIVSNTPITEVPSVEDCPTPGLMLYINNGEKTWFTPDRYGIIDFGPELGATYYVRSFYYLDGKTHLGKEVTKRCPKTINGVINKENITLYGNFISFTGMDEAKQQLKDKYGSITPYLGTLLTNKCKDYAKSLTEEQRAAAAQSTEVCDDGTIYFLPVPENLIREMTAQVDAEGNTPFYVQANEQTLLPAVSSRNYYGYFIGSQGTVETVHCDEAWGVRDNQYVTTVVNSSTAFSPTLGIGFDHVMLPGKTYDISFSIAPQTDTLSTDTLALNFYVFIADSEWDFGTFNVAAPTIKNPEVTEGTQKQKCTFVAEPDKVTTYTIQYTPQRFSYTHAFEVVNSQSVFLTTAKKRYGRNIRLIGIDVRPAEGSGN